MMRVHPQFQLSFNNTSPREAREGLRDYLRFYHEERLHQSLD